MKYRYVFIWPMICLSFMNLNCRKEFIEIVNTVNFEGRNYGTIYFEEINQTWMAQNMVRGEMIPEGTTRPSITNGKIEYYCFGDEPSNCEDNDKQAAFYTWEEATQTLWSAEIPSESIIIGICPIGWRIPRLKDWMSLFDYLGYSGNYTKGVFPVNDNTGEKLKMKRYCIKPDSPECNESAFSAEMNGRRTGNGAMPYFESEKETMTYFWTSNTDPTRTNNAGAFYIHLKASQKSVFIGQADKFTNGYCVRCVKDGRIK